MLLLLVLLLAAATTATGAHGRAVTTSLVAQWPRSSLSSLAEVGEYLADEHRLQSQVGSSGSGSRSSFWAYLEIVGGSVDESQDVESLAVAAAVEAGELDDADIQLLHLFLSSHTYSITVESHRALASASAQSCGYGETHLDSRDVAAAWAVLLPSGTVACSVESLELELLQMQQQQQQQQGEEEKEEGFCGELYPSSTADGILPHDHVYRTDAGGEGDAAAVLYGALGTPSMLHLHRLLKAEVDAGRLGTYIFRHALPLSREELSSSSNLQGFGVYLDIKDMEYSAINSSEEEEEPTEGDETSEQGKVLTDDEPDLDTDGLKISKLRDLGLQALLAIVDLSTDPIEVLEDISQNFPLHAAPLSKRRVPRALRSEVGVLQQLTSSMSAGMLYINGLPNPLDAFQFNVFGLLKTLRKEAAQLRRVQGLHLPVQTREVLAMALDADMPPPGGPGENVRIDVLRDPAVKAGGVIWINNIERDAAYSSWSRSLSSLMGFGFGGGQRVRRNWAHLLLCVDPMTAHGREALQVLLPAVAHQQIPVRLAVLLVSDEDLRAVKETGTIGESGEATARDVAELSALALRQEHGRGGRSVLDFLLDVTGGEEGGPGTRQELVRAYAQALGGDDDEKEAWAALQERPEGGEIRSDSAALKMARLAASKGLPSGGCWMLNGRMFEDVSAITTSLMQAVQEEQYLLIQMLMDGSVTDASRGLYSKLLSHPSISVFQKHHPLLSESPSSLRLQLLESPEADEWVRRLWWHHSPGTAGDIKPLSFILALDPSSRGGIKALRSVLSLLHDSPAPGSSPEEEALSSFSREKMRVAIAWNPSPALLQACQASSSSGSVEEVEIGLRLMRVMEALNLEREMFPSAAAGASLALLEALEASPEGGPEGGLIGLSLDLLRGEAVLRDALAGAEAEDGLEGLEGLVGRFTAAWGLQDGCAKSLALMEEQAAITRRVLGLDAGEQEVVANGRRMALGAHTALGEAELSLLSDSQAPLAEYVASAALEWDWSSFEWEGPGAARPEAEADLRSSCLMRLMGFLQNYQRQGRVPILSELRALPELMGSKEPLQSLVTVEPAHNRPQQDPLCMQIVAVLDPLSMATQRVASVLRVLRDDLGLSTSLLLVPQPRVRDMPLQNFYRFVFGSAAAAGGDVAMFEGLPPQHVLTMRLDTPEAWNVQQLTAVQDTANLRCDVSECGDDGTTSTSVGYELKHILLSGQCFDKTAPKTPSPPTGLQLRLARGDSTSTTDTVVMQNYGYFQVKATPGAWLLGPAEGQSAELFSIIPEGASAVAGSNRSSPALPPVEQQQQQWQVAVVDSFESHVEKLSVRKRPGLEHETLRSLSAKAAQAKASAGSTSSSGDSDEDPYIHVFSLATGHLYERFLRIMMLSAHKRSPSKPLKFWLLENFLSPSFKDSAAAMAREYGFAVEYVTYKWPEWLLQQTELQRVIWGYKILFLDVLFPIDVKKVIYIDADQVIRADLAELWELDLQGHSYAYTPFCSSRESTLGYQFWRGGFWKNHLAGNAYHISALYVVDLEVFRQHAVGDSLRSVYNSLARDPNSLSNLDQDLPNYAQHEVPIFSLPQEWLWCESWCSDESKASAKTIDLCNNPQHKEPKLDMAKRVISGPLFEESWLELDEEVKSVQRRAGLLPS